MNLSKDEKLMREDSLKFARVLLVQTKAPEAVVVVVVVLPGFLLIFDVAALFGLCAENMQNVPYHKIVHYNPH